MWSDTPTVKDDKRSRSLVLWREAYSDDIIRLYMSCTCYVQDLDSFVGGLTPIWPFPGNESLTWTIFYVFPTFCGPNHAKLWSWLGNDVVDAAIWSKSCTMCISKRSRSLVWHIVTCSDVTTMLPMMCRVPLVILVWFCAHFDMCLTIWSLCGPAGCFLEFGHVNLCHFWKPLGPHVTFDV